MTKPGDLRRRALLAVFAHPDDESLTCGGLLAWCAHLGADVALLCLTEGEHGQGGPALARTRRRELAGAARALGVSATTLLDHEDGMLPWLDAARLEADIAAAIRRRRPEAVITFDWDGVYGHPDHCAVHARTTAAVAALGEAAPALYYVTLPPGAMRAVADHAARGFRDLPPRGATGAPSTSILGIDDPDAFGAEAPAPTLVVDAGAFAEAKLAALACHATQFRGSALEAVAPADAPRLLGIEHYRRAAVGAAGPTFLDAFAAPLTGTATRSSPHPPGRGGDDNRTA